MTFQSQPKHKYTTLADILKKFPVPADLPTQVNTYGIILSYDEQKNEVTLMDETRDEFKAYINPVYDPNAGKVVRDKKKMPVRLPFKTGDILRIHRLVLNRDFKSRSYKAADLVVFKSFKDKHFVPTYLSTNPSFSQYDVDRVKKLEDLSVTWLLGANVKHIHTFFSNWKNPKQPGRRNNYLITHTAFQVVAVEREEKRHIIVAWNGAPFNNYPCHPSVSLDLIIEKFSLAKRPKEGYDVDFIRRLYETEKLIFITVYGQNHRLTAHKLQPMDVIVIFGLIVKPDKFFYEKFSFLLFESEIFGRAIRFCSPKSSIGKLFENSF